MDYRQKRLFSLSRVDLPNILPMDVQIRDKQMANRSLVTKNHYLRMAIRYSTYLNICFQ